MSAHTIPSQLRAAIYRAADLAEKALARQGPRA